MSVVSDQGGWDQCWPHSDHHHLATTLSTMSCLWWSITTSHSPLSTIRGFITLSQWPGSFILWIEAKILYQGLEWWPGLSWYLPVFSSVHSPGWQAENNPFVMRNISFLPAIADISSTTLLQPGSEERGTFIRTAMDDGWLGNQAVYPNNKKW